MTSPVGFERFEQDPQVCDAAAKRATSLRMGDIAQTSAAHVNLEFRVHGRAPIERVDVLNGMKNVTTIYNAADAAGSDRIRVLWRGAMVKGRGARASWNGRARFENCDVRSVQEINAWNPDRVLTRDSEDSLSWESVTAGNFGAFDVWLDEREGARLHFETGHVNGSVDLADIGRDDLVIPGGGLDLEMRLFRLPSQMCAEPLAATLEVPLHDNGDNPLWIRVTTEDGFQAWTSPVYLFR